MKEIIITIEITTNVPDNYSDEQIEEVVHSSMFIPLCECEITKIDWFEN